jgi:hypothetical protein
MLRPVTPGLAVGCVELVGVVGRNNPTQSALNSGRTLSLPTQDILEFAVYVNWVRVQDDGSVVLTPAGGQVFASQNCRTNLRTFLRDYIQIADPPWVRLAALGRRDVLLQAPDGVRQLLVESGMAYSCDDDVVQWWDQLGAESRGYKNSRLTEIGRAGERLTLAYEEKRTGRVPKWVAIESNADGYDVLSVVSSTDSRRLAIEVKTSQQDVEAGSFYVTRHEWDTACDSLCHVFHVWDICRECPRLAVLTVDEVADHVPLDKGAGAWQTSKVPLRAFVERFSDNGHCVVG